METKETEHLPDVRNKMTAVEWLGEQIRKFHKWKASEQLDENKFDAIDLLLAVREAKQMEKEQIIDAHGIKNRGGFKSNGNFFVDEYTGEQYYYETYGK